MVTVRFYGDLKKFGSSFKLDVATVPEALRALLTQIPGLRSHMERGEYKVRADGKYLSEDSVDSHVNSTLHLTPVTKGAGKNGGIIQTVLGAVMLVVAYVLPVTAPYLVPLGVGLISGGIAQLLTKMPKMDSMSDSDALKSSSFSNLLNMAAQGAPVPIVYGEMMIGSKVLSQGIRSVPIMSGSSNWNNGFQINTTTVWGRFAALMIRKAPESISNQYRFDSTNENVVGRNYTKSLVEE